MVCSFLRDSTILVTFLLSPQSSDDVSDNGSVGGGIADSSNSTTYSGIRGVGVYIPKNLFLTYARNLHSTPRMELNSFSG